MGKDAVKLLALDLLKKYKDLMCGCLSIAFSHLREPW